MKNQWCPGWQTSQKLPWKLSEAQENSIATKVQLPLEFSSMCTMTPGKNLETVLEFETRNGAGVNALLSEGLGTNVPEIAEVLEFLQFSYHFFFPSFWHKQALESQKLGHHF